MIPQERGIEGLSVYSYSNYPFFSKGGDRLREILGEGQEVLDSPQEILKPIPGMIVGLVVGSFSPSLLHLYHSIPHALSCTHLHAPTYPFIDPSSPAPVSWLGKGAELLKNSLNIAGCSGHWCDPAAT